MAVSYPVQKGGDQIIATTDYHLTEIQIVCRVGIHNVNSVTGVYKDMHLMHKQNPIGTATIFAGSIEIKK